jgi:hypothetical protein
MLAAGETLRRAVIAGVSGGLAVLALLLYQGWRRDKAAVEVQAAAFGIPQRQAQLALGIVREPDTHRAALALARVLLAEVSDRRQIARLPLAEAAREVAREGEKLEVARDLAGSVWAHRPACGEAAMVLGGTLYLWRAFAPEGAIPLPTAWETPLQLARALAPAQPEAMRLLAVAALERWPVLEEGERAAQLTFLREAFGDPVTLAALAGPWLRIAGEVSTAFGAVPDTASAWATVAGACAQRRDWSAYCEAHRRRLVALERELRAAVEEARERVQGGDAARARGLCWQVVRTAPPDVAFAGVLTTALEIAPAGPVDAHTGGAAAAWLEWALEGVVRGVERLPAPVVARLATAATEVEPASAALAALAAGDVAGAELRERRSEATTLEAWAPYLLAKARHLAARGEWRAAQATLASVHRSWRGVLWADVAWLVARAAGDEAAAREAAAQRAALAAESWPATAWRWHRGVARLDLLLASAAPGGLTCGIDQAPPGGAVVAVRLDGRGVELAPVRSGGQVVIATALPAGLHLVEVEAVAGGKVAPGAVWCTAPSPP